MAYEKRAHARIAAPITAYVVVGSQETELTVRDISRGGIFLYSQAPPGVVGSSVVLKLGLSGGIKPVLVRGKLARIVTEPSSRGRVPLGFGVRFTGNDVATDRALIQLIERSLLGPGTHSRAYPRVYYLLEVTCYTKEELGGLLRDIGEGGAGLTVDRALAKDDEVVVQIARPAPHKALRLKGWVVSCESLPDNPVQHRVGVRFARQTEDTRKALLAFISELVKR